MDATELLALLRKGFPASHRSGRFNAGVLEGNAFTELFDQLHAPHDLLLLSKDGWQAEGSLMTLRGRTEQTLLGIRTPSVFLRLQPDGERWALLFGLIPPVNWRFSHSFPQHRYDILDTLVCRALVVASTPLDVPANWLHQVTSAQDSKTPGADAGTLHITESPALYGLEANASTLISADRLAEVVAGGSLKVAISLGLLGAPPGGLTEHAPEVVASLPAACASDSTLIQRNETWCAFDQQRRITHAYLALYAFDNDGWSFLPGCVLSDVQLRFSSIRPADNRSIQSFSLGAKFNLGGLPILVNGHLPAATLSGSLDPDVPPPSLQGVVEKLFDHKMDGKLQINRLEFWAQKDSGRYGAALAIAGNWRFDLDLQRYIEFMSLEVELEKTLAGYAGHLGGSFRINEQHAFSIELDFSKDATRIKGEWQSNASSLDFNDMLDALRLPRIGALPGNRTLCLISADFVFDSGTSSFALNFKALLQNANTPGEGTTLSASLVAGKSPEAGMRWGFLCAMDLDLQLELGLDNLPLAGALVPKDTPALRIDQLRLIAASKAVPSIPADSKLAALSKLSLDSGLALAVDLGLGKEQSKTLMVRFGGKKAPPALPSPKPLPATTNHVPPVAAQAEDIEEDLEQDVDKAGWIDVQRTFGPLRIQRIGFSMTDDGALGVALDAGITTRGLGIDLHGLKADMPLQSGSSARFGLAGLGIQFRTPALSISGALNRYQKADEPEEYEGELAISAGTFSATAIGLYTTVKEQPSFVAYTFIGVPLGGPPCFFVTGVAGGLGYNRSLRLPEIDKVGGFPLVRAAMGSANADEAKMGLAEYVKPDPGQDWLAAGVRFTSFKMLDSFALLTVSFGTRSEIALLGRSTLSLPPSPKAKGNNPVVQADLLIKASLQLEEGVLSVNAQLSPASYVFSRDARLTGGFAFYLWFGKNPGAGDFVVTLGGYHPQFKAPPHYPQVPRLGLNWRVSNNLTIKGELYFALTPSLIMAGGLLDATWQSDGVRAWFQVQAHFLMRFKPFTYRISASVSIGVSARVDLWLTSYTLDTRVSANLELWGPDFGGMAVVDLSVVSFTIDFGEKQRPSDAPIKWQEFRESFLPSEVNPPPVAGTKLSTGNALISLSAPAGLLGSATRDDDSLWVVDGADLSLVLGTQVPSTRIEGVSLTDNGGWNRSIGVGPMDKNPGALESVLTVAIIPSGSAWSGEVVLGNVPAGLWGNNRTDMQKPPLVRDALLGLRLRPVAPAVLNALTVAGKELRNPQWRKHALAWSQARPAPRQPVSSDSLAALRASLPEHKQRSAILAALLRQKLPIDDKVELKGLADNAEHVLQHAPLLAGLGSS